MSISGAWTSRTPMDVPLVATHGLQRVHRFHHVCELGPELCMVCALRSLRLALRLSRSAAPWSAMDEIGPAFEQALVKSGKLGNKLASIAGSLVSGTPLVELRPRCVGLAPDLREVARWVDRSSSQVCSRNVGVLDTAAIAVWARARALHTADVVMAFSPWWQLGRASHRTSIRRDHAQPHSAIRRRSTAPMAR